MLKDQSNNQTEWLKSEETNLPNVLLTDSSSLQFAQGHRGDMDKRTLCF